MTRRYVWIVADLPLAFAARATLNERLASMEPEVAPYGGVTRRIRLTVDSDEAIGAAEEALAKLRLLLSEWNIANSYVDEVSLVESVDEAWAHLAK